MNRKTDVYISRGNIKVRANIFNLPVGKTCKKGTVCRSFCYALKAEKAYKGALPRRKKNLNAAKKKGFVNEVVGILSKRKKKITRIHESGDFYSKEYIEKWYTIAERLPNMQFYAYTKRNDLFNKSLIARKPANLRLHWSIDGIHKNEEDVTPEVTRKLKQGYDIVSVIREDSTGCLHQINPKMLCMEKCKICITGKVKLIEFKIH